MNKEELEQNKLELQIELGEAKLTVDRIDPKYGSYKYRAALKNSIYLLQKNIEAVDKEIKKLKKPPETTDQKHNRMFVKIAKSILDEELFEEISKLARGV